MIEFKIEDVEMHHPAHWANPGGQHVTKTDTSVLAIHKPTGIAFVSRSERSQHGNRERAIQRLRGLLILVDKVE